MRRKPVFWLADVVVLVLLLGVLAPASAQPTSTPEATICPVNETYCPPSETTCPAYWTKYPALETTCPAVETTCPTKATTCPPTLTECQVKATYCPTVETTCPPETTKCPGGFTYCPLGPTTCPMVATQCPAELTQCPAELTKCPAELTKCPVLATYCPPEQTKCPAAETTCPAVETTCPTVTTTCPPNATECPGGLTYCPPEQTKCPAVETQCPAEQTKCPTSETTCPTVTTTCPPNATECPGGLTYCPPEQTKCPAVETQCPAGYTYCPTLQTKCPAAETTCPAVETHCPPESTGCPTYTKLVASDGASGNYFGDSIAISGDAVVVGAPGEGVGKGSAYVFKRTATGWAQDVKLVASDGASGDWFGDSIAFSGDAVVVRTEGSAYIFQRTATGWLQNAKLLISDANTYFAYDNSVAISGDVVIVGAPGEDVQKGSAYVFKRTATGWVQDVKLVASDGTAGDWFGACVAVDGDTAVVGAFGSADGLGAAYVFRHATTGWYQETKLFANDSVNGDWFGGAVAICQDVVVIGASATGAGPLSTGFAYVFRRTSSGWTRECKLIPSDPSAGQQFGESVAISRETIIVGAPNKGNEGTGSTYVFEHGNTGWIETRKLTPTHSTPYTWLGFSVAITGNTVAIGAPFFYLESGSAYVIELAGSDTVPPRVSISAPLDGAVVSSTAVAVTGSVTEESATTVTSTPPGISTTLPSGGGLVGGIVTIPSVDGPHTITLSAQDEAGNVGGTSIGVVLDTTEPPTTITSPPEGTVLGDTLADFSISVSDATSVTVKFGLNDMIIPGGSGTATGSVSLEEGLNQVLVVVTDAAGNQTTLVRNVTVDLSAPIVEITTPLNNTILGPGQTSIPVTAKIDDLTVTTITSNPSGLSGTVEAGGGYKLGVIGLTEGYNTITVNATDAANHTSSCSITVILDTTAPTVTLNSPYDSDAVRGTIDFNATVIDPLPGSGVTSAVFKVDNSPVTTLVAPPYEIMLDTSALTDGFHTLSVTATDGKGNGDTKTITVRVDNAPPVATIPTPLANAFVKGTIDFHANVSDTGSGLASVKMWANGISPTTDASITYVSPLGSDTREATENTTRWPDGDLILKATATDAAGNQATAQVQVTVDNTAPTKTLISPVDQSVVSGTIWIEAEAADTNFKSLEIRVDGQSLLTSSLSHVKVPYDTTIRLDGTMVVEAIATDLATNISTSQATVTVNNITFRLTPVTLNLESKGQENSITAHLEGVNLSLLVPPTGHTVELRVPGGSPILVSSSTPLADCDEDQVPDANLKFSRQALIAAIKAGIATEKIEPNGDVPVQLVVDNDFVIGTATIRIKGGE